MFAGRSAPAHRRPHPALRETILGTPAKHSGNRGGLASRLVKQRGAIMLATFLNAIYREVLRVSTSGMTRWG